jgi:hypothetical protein
MISLRLANKEANVVGSLLNAALLDANLSIRPIRSHSTTPSASYDIE